MVSAGSFTPGISRDELVNRPARSGFLLGRHVVAHVRESRDHDTASVDDAAEASEDRIEPGSPRLENVVFIALGILSTLAVVVHLINLFG